jgi:hypothetical protein
MPEIEELPEEFDELTDKVETDDELIESTKILDSKQDKIETEKPTNDNYDFDKATVIINLQILPLTTQLERKVLISAGIKGEPPLINSTTFTEIEQLEVFADILEKLKRSLPEIVEKAKLRAIAERQKIQSLKKPQRVVSTPELPQPSSTLSQPSSQLSLF